MNIFPDLELHMFSISTIQAGHSITQWTKSAQIDNRQANV